MNINRKIKINKWLVFFILSLSCKTNAWEHILMELKFNKSDALKWEVGV